MFDNIRCEVPLPDGFTGELQTKDFGCEMVTHVITKGGRLMLDRGHYEEVPKAERRHPNEDGILGLAGSIRRVTNYVDANFHGYVHFYGTGDHDYRAKFTDGQLVSVEFDPDT